MLIDLLPRRPFIGLVDRGRVSTKSNTLGGVIMNPWDSELWNAADWYRVKG